MHGDLERPFSGGSTSASLIQRAKDRDPLAWERLVDLYGPLVFFWCRSGGLEGPDAADVVQEVFAAVWAALDRFEHRRHGAAFRGWLRVITRNKIRDHYHRRGREAQGAGGTAANRRLADLPAPDLADELSERQAMDSLHRRALELVRAEFEDRTWQAFWRLVVEGHDTAHVAADLGLSPNAVRQYKSRVLRRLREEFGDLLE